ncbi:hypothetical protein IFM89_038310 [Coptis chinensis]|uniref:Kinesin light chain n=1 Tax=Coptis chinensis TaxID=261450 RepID=A0A835M0R9_9MAGN|nr:hypothetical protein IFM89_038310 [Coptis chinensis]
MMKRATSSFLSHLTSTHKRSNLYKNLFTNTCPIPINHLVLNPKSHHQSRNINTLRQRKVKEKVDIEEEFEAAVSTDDILKAFKSLETVFDKNEPKYGLACLKVGLHLDDEGEEPETALQFGLKAFNILDKGDKNLSIPLAMTLHLMGSASYNLKRFSDSLGYLNKANRLLVKLQSEGCSDKEILLVLHTVQLGLANAKTAMGRNEEALENYTKGLEIKEMTLDPESKELGVAYRQVAEAYAAVMSFNDGLPYCLKALKIHKAHLGDNSIEVAHDRRILGVIYTGMQEFQKALEQNVLSQKVLKQWGCKDDLLRAELDAANTLISLGNYEEAINSLKSVVLQTDKDSKTRALVFIEMANAMCKEETYGNAKRCLEISTGIFDKKETEFPAEVADAYMEIAGLYVEMNEFEPAVSLYKRALSIFEKLPQEQHAEGTASAKLGWLLLLTDKVPQAIPYMENAAELLKESFGPKHFSVAYIYNNLGAAYLELERPQSAAQMFAVAKDIMDVSLGPHHADSIEACQNLSKAYSAMRSYHLAIDFQQCAVDAWESHGPTAEDELKEATRVLEQLKKEACGSTTEHVLTKALAMRPRARSVSIEKLKK